MIFTTSRYASQVARDSARSMAQKAKGRYVARGKKTINALIEYARRLGESEIIFIGFPKTGNKKVKTEKLAMVRIDSTRSWHWVCGSVA